MSWGKWGERGSKRVFLDDMGDVRKKDNELSGKTEFFL